MTKTRTILSLLGLVSVAGVAAYAQIPAADAPAETDRPDRPQVRVAGGIFSEDTESTCALPVGARMRYDVSTKTRTRIDLRPLADQMHATDDAVGFSATPKIDRAAERSWQVDFEVVEHDGDGATVLAAHIDDGGVVEEGTASAEPPADIDRTFLVRLDEQCSIVEFGWRADGDRRSAREQQTLVAALNFLAPPPDGATSYAGAAFDAAGFYQGEFSATDSTIEGKAVIYDEPFVSGEGVDAELEVESSALRVGLTPGLWFETLTHTRSLSVRARGHALGTFDASTRAVLVEPGPWRSEVPDTDDGWAWGLLLGQPMPAASPRDQFDPALVNVPLTDVVASYLDALAAGKHGSHAAEVLVQWLRANPEAAGELVAMVSGGSFDDNPIGYASTFLALAKADTDQATAALTGLVAERGARGKDAISAAHAMSMVATPDAGMVDALVHYAERGDVHAADRGTVAMALGTFAAENEARAPELAATANEHIKGWLDEPADGEDLANSLFAAGNSGHDDLAAAVEPYLDDERAEIRQYATHALRRMSPEQAYPRLASSAADENEAVRVKALQVAAEVSHNRGVAPPPRIVDTAIDALAGGAGQAEEAALVGLLGQASRLGSENAANALAERFEEERLSAARDPERLRALGQHSNVRWTADG